jgi:hypothetical protein
MTATEVQAREASDSTHTAASHWPRGSNLGGPLYPRLLRLRHVNPSAWQRAMLVEGTLLVGALAALADKVTAWAPLILLAAVAVIVKFHDLLTGVLYPAAPAGDQTTEPTAEAASDTDRAPAAASRAGDTPLVRVVAPPAEAVAAAAARAAVEAELADLEAEATAMAQELLALDGEIHPFALAVDGDGDIVLVTAAEAYARRDDSERVEALWGEVRELAQAGSVRAAVVASPTGAGIRLESEHATAGPRRVELTPDRRGSLEAGAVTPGARHVERWS